MSESRSPDTSGLAMFIFRLMLVVVFFFAGGRLYQLQILEGEQYRARADANRFELVEIPAPRGVIYDRNGPPLRWELYPMICPMMI
jgi:cell division protein FtsI/penicillin-binding protein 2